MDNIEFNKIFAAILVAGIIASLSGFLSKKLVHKEELEEHAYKIEGVEEAGGSGPRIEPKAEPILGLLAAVDIARGEKIAKQCAACHSFDKGGAHGVGPYMYGVVGKQKQSKAGYAYSGVLNANGGDTWTYAELNKFLWKPKKYAPGTKMNFLGIKKPADRAALIAWMNTQSDKPLSLPSEAQIKAELIELAPLPEGEEIPVE